MTHSEAHYAEMDLRRSADGRLNQTQRRTEGLVKMLSDFDTIEKIDPFTQMASNPGSHARGRARRR